jgi:hypothetical protein
LRQQLTINPQSSTIKEEILERILEEKKQEIGLLEQELTALGEQLDKSLEIRLQVLSGSDSVKDEKIKQLKSQVQSLTEYGSSLIEQKENKIKSLIRENSGLKIQLEFSQGRMRAAEYSTQLNKSGRERLARKDEFEETLYYFLSFLAGYGVSLGLNLWLNSLVTSENPGKAKKANNYNRR